MAALDHGGFGPNPLEPPSTSTLDVALEDVVSYCGEPKPASLALAKKSSNKNLEPKWPRKSGPRKGFFSLFLLQTQRNENSQITLHGEKMPSQENFTSPLGHDATKPTPHGTMASDHQHHHQVSNRAVSWQMRVLLHTPKSLTNAFAMLAPPFSVGWAVRSGLSPWQVSRGTNEFLATTCPRLHRPERQGALCCEAQRILGRSFLYAF